MKGITLLKGALIGALGCGLVGCATEQNYRDAVNSWRNVNTTYLYRAWGYPDRIKRLPNGHRLLVYRSIDRGHYPTTVMPGSTSISTTNGRTEVFTTPSVVTGGR